MFFDPLSIARDFPFLYPNIGKKLGIDTFILSFLPIAVQASMEYFYCVSYNWNVRNLNLLKSPFLQGLFELDLVFHFCTHGIIRKNLTVNGKVWIGSDEKRDEARAVFSGTAWSGEGDRQRGKSFTLLLGWAYARF